MPSTAANEVHSHILSFKGVAGSIFYCLVAAILFSIIAFTTEGWAQLTTKDGGVKVGLWMTCLCRPNLVHFTSESWFKSTQAMVTIGMVCIVGGIITVLIYLFMHKVNKTRVIRIVTLWSLMAVIFTVIGLTIFGVFTVHYEAMQGFSFVFTIISSLLTATACFLSCVQMVRSKSCLCSPCCKCCKQQDTND